MACKAAEPELQGTFGSFLYNLSDLYTVCLKSLKLQEAAAQTGGADEEEDKDSESKGKKACEERKKGRKEG